MKSRYAILWALPLLILLLTGCQKERIQHLNDVSAIRAYLEAKNITAEQDPEADYFYYFYVDNNRQQLVTANSGLTLKVRYKAELLDGTVVADTGTDFELIELDQAIYGWRLALPRMSIGERMLLVLPSRLAYADEESPTIPPYSNLVFDIELLDVYPQF